MRAAAASFPSAAPAAPPPAHNASLIGPVSPYLPEAAFSQSTRLPAVVRVATSLPPHMGVVDFGGTGSCGPIHLGAALVALGLALPHNHKDLGRAVRAEAVRHLSTWQVQTSVIWKLDDTGYCTIAEAMVESLRCLKRKSALCPLTCAAYLEHMSLDSTFFENIALQGFADRSRCLVRVRMYEHDGSPSPSLSGDGRPFVVRGIQRRLHVLALRCLHHFFLPCFPAGLPPHTPGP